MLSEIKLFATDECGAITVDWIVLTGVLAATGMAVMSTVSGGVENVAVDTSAELRGQVIRQSFGSNLCSSGIDGLRAREASRVASGGQDPVNVDTWMDTYTAGLSDAALMEERERASKTASNEGGWTRENTILGLLECGMALRGLG